MVKKYKLTGSNNQNGGGLNFMYPVIPSMTGLTPSNPQVITSNIVNGPPFITGNGSYIRADPTGGLKIGMPLVNGTGNGLQMIIPPAIDTKDPSVFLGLESKPATGTPGPVKDVTLTYKEPMPKQSLLMYQPNLPIIPNPYGLQFPVGLQPTAPIVLNPTESQARLEISSPDSDDIITISGEENKIKPVYEGIQKKNKVRLAQDEVTLAQKEWDGVKGRGYPYFDEDIKIKTEEDIKAIPDIKPEQIKAGLRLKKAKEQLRKAKKEASMTDDDTDVPDKDLIPLDQLIDITEITKRIENDFGVDKKDFTTQSNKKNNLQLLLGLPFGNRLNYGPVISGL